MNSAIDDHETRAADDPLRMHLSALPTPPASAALWSRIEHTRQRRQLRRRLVTTVGVAAVVVLAALNLPMPGQQPARGSGAGVANAIAIEPDLRAIDHQLQAAYDHAADPAQIQALWQAREQATRTATTRSIEDDRIIRL